MTLDLLVYTKNIWFFITTRFHNTKFSSLERGERFPSCTSMSQVSALLSLKDFRYISFKGSCNSMCDFASFQRRKMKFLDFMLELPSLLRCYKKSNHIGWIYYDVQFNSAERDEREENVTNTLPLIILDTTQKDFNLLKNLSQGVVFP